MMSVESQDRTSSTIWPISTGSRVSKMLRGIGKVVVLGLILPASGAFAQGLQHPRNPVALDSGVWDWNSAVLDHLLFVNTPSGGTAGNFYDDCAGIELFHPQHVVRLPNKNGQAYFMVAQSRSHAGYIQVLRTNPGQLDTATDLVVSGGIDSPVGEYIWMDNYGPTNPIGNWNHPGKMQVIGNLLIVAAQNWDEDGVCTYGPGIHDDAVLFYDVSDPENPTYWGLMTQSQLGLSEIEGVALLKVPNAEKWVLSVGGGGDNVNFVTTSVSPSLADWTPVPVGQYTSGQHGIHFNSYQRIHGAAVPGDSGYERVIYFDTLEAKAFRFWEYHVDASTSGFTSLGIIQYEPNVFGGAERDWDADSVYVTTGGTPIIYTMLMRPGDNGVIKQVHVAFNSVMSEWQDQFAPPELCGNENDTCSLPRGGMVAYGANGMFNKSYFIGEFGCNNSSFGDPIGGVAKACYTTSF